MNTAMLTYKDASLTPEERWLLMQWASTLGPDQSFDGTLKNLFKSLAMTYAQGYRAWNMLNEKQDRFVEIETLPAKRRGRPRSRYRLSAKLIKKLEAGPLASQQHTSDIAKLAKTTRLSAENKAMNLIEESRLRLSSLSISNRWLLMVLLAHADTPGVITRLGILKIRHLTGMSRSRIDRQLKKLGDLGVIAYHQPGRYSSQASTRKTSIYLLDLAHPLLGAFKRAPLTIVLPSSTKKHKQTELIDGTVDAVMTAAVCSLQIKALLEEHDSVEASKSFTVDSTVRESKLKHDPYHEARSYQEKYNKIDRILKDALELLPSTRYLDGGIVELFKGYDAKDADWLLTSVHIDTSRLLTSAWDDLKEGLLGPDQPSHNIIIGTARRLGLKPEYVIEEKPEDEPEVSPAPHSSEASEAFNAKKPPRSIEATPIAKEISYPPLAVLLYALSHHLAKWLQSVSELNGHEDVEAMTYMLVPIYPKPTNDQLLSAFQLRSYGLLDEQIDKEPMTIMGSNSVSEDLKTYWRTHHQACLSAIKDEPDDATASEAQEPTDA